MLKLRPLSICLQNQPATTGKAETMPDISAERRVGTDNVLTRRDPQPHFYAVHPATTSSLKRPVWQCVQYRSP